jgi:hypothetical protein
MIYTWKITGVKTKTEGIYEKSIVQVYWSKTGTDENQNSGSFHGVTAFTSLTKEENEQFIPFEDITDDMLVDWLKTVVVGDYETYVNNFISKQILK